MHTTYAATLRFDGEPDDAFHRLLEVLARQLSGFGIAAQDAFSTDGDGRCRNRAAQ